MSSTLPFWIGLAATVALLAVLKHPFARLGLDRAVLLTRLRRLERRALR
jgi:inactivated superfamily I helicase